MQFVVVKNITWGHPIKVETYTLNVEASTYCCNLRYPVEVETSTWKSKLNFSSQKIGLRQFLGDLVQRPLGPTAGVEGTLQH